MVEENPLGSDVDIEMIGKPQDLLGDGGIIKTISVAGTGTATPRSGSSVTVHYVGTLDDGTEFDSSRGRDEPFVFDLGAGKVIKGWDQGVATMKKGERCVLRCAPDYAYGSSSQGAIPANSTLNFDVELLSFTEWKDVSEKQDGTIMQKMLSEDKAEGYRRPPDFDTKMVFTYGIRKDEDKDELVDKQDAIVVIGDETFPPALEEGLKKLHEGERSLLKFAPSASPNGEEIIYEFDVKEVVAPKQEWDCSTEEKLEMAKLKKEEGTALFKEGKLNRARGKYDMGIGFIASDYQMTDEQKTAATELKATLRLNLAAVALKMKDWKEVIAKCTDVLSTDGSNTRALLRRGRAHNQQDDWEAAQADLNAVLAQEGCPEAADARKELAALRKKIQKQNQKDKVAYGNMFDRIRVKEAPKKEEKEVKPEETGAAPAAEPAPEAAPMDTDESTTTDKADA